jgi:hypothetical protein
MGSDNTRQSGRVLTLTSDYTFQDFDSVCLIDAGAADGYQLAGDNDVYGVIPTGIVVNLGGANGRVGKKFSIKAASGKSLNVTAIVY